MTEGTQPEAVIRIAMVDDHQMFIDGVRSLLQQEATIDWVGEALSGPLALARMDQWQPHLVITDFSMPGMSGAEFTRSLKASHPHIKVLVVTMYNDPAILAEILDTDAEGCILKNTGRAELMQAISKIADDGTFYSAEVLQLALAATRKQKQEANRLAELTEREIEIIRLIAQEFSTAEIADRLFISPRTVDTHRKNILRKTQARTLVGLIRFAFSNGLA
jgi:DNA-binding NarL/FixJ family response regulator